MYGLKLGTKFVRNYSSTSFYFFLFTLPVLMTLFEKFEMIVYIMCQIIYITIKLRHTSLKFSMDFSFYVLINHIVMDFVFKADHVQFRKCVNPLCCRFKFLLGFFVAQLNYPVHKQVNQTTCSWG